MGSSHGAHVLMTINARVCPMALRRPLVDFDRERQLKWIEMLDDD